MVFVPFTGVDNHNKSITFAVGLLLNEDIPSYVWLFENFKKAMGNEPHVLLTDQDPAVISAVDTVFKHTTHRFCIWHIMFKLPSKLPSSTYNHPDFKKRFNDVVWSTDLSREEFAQSWHQLLYGFKLDSNHWLLRMFSLRSFWICAFFNDVEMGGLMRTTSRSESQNSFFSTFINPHATLVEFMM